MDKATIRNTIINTIRQIAEEQSISIGSIKGDHAIVDDLGFASLDVATLVAMLESLFHVDPLTKGDVSITDIRQLMIFAKLIANIY